MIVGNGDIASVLAKIDNNRFLFFASGVSDSSETRESEFRREQDLLFAQQRAWHLVYFSTLSVFYSDSRYATHKRRQEERIKAHFPNYTIVRIGNITWGDNPHTLINYLRTHPEAEIQDVWRYVVDEDEFLYWVGMIPGFNCEMNIPGRRMKVADIQREYA